MLHLWLGGLTRSAVTGMVELVLPYRLATERNEVIKIDQNRDQLLRGFCKFWSANGGER